ncbi:MAG: monovalent cation/H+ antiporter complex subunit F [Turicibacter sp.]|nr:monovalent cation/H+ antiporter complex subunit F [Turicibacter sp.]
MSFVWIMLVFLFIYMVFVIRGPTIWDRLLAMSIISAKIIMLIILFASASGILILLDFAIIYALFGFITVIFIALFLSERNKKKEE